MACGTPVVTSNVSSLPEVAGDAALLVDPYDVEAHCRRDACGHFNDQPLRRHARGPRPGPRAAVLVGRIGRPDSITVYQDVLDRDEA